MTYTAKDAADNTATASFKVTVVDTTPTVIVPLANITVYAATASGTPVSFSTTATGLVDGPCAVSYWIGNGSGGETAITSPHTFPVGASAVTAKSHDTRNNQSSMTFTVSVVYSWNGFFQPIGNNGVFNKVKAGSAIPVKSSLHGDYGLFIFSAGYPKAVTVPKSSMAVTDMIEEVIPTASTSGLRYDSLADQYIYVWKTEKGCTGCKRLDVKLIDGNTYSAYFEFVK